MGPRVAAVHTLQFATRQQQLQLWQDTLQLVQGGSGPRQLAEPATNNKHRTGSRIVTLKYTFSSHAVHGMTGVGQKTPSSGLVG